MSIQRAAAIIDNMTGEGDERDELIQLLVDLLKSEMILDVAVAVEHWRQRRAIIDRYGSSKLN